MILGQVQLDPATIAQLVQKLGDSASGRSDAVWIAAIVIGGVFALFGLVLHFAVIPWFKNRMAIDTKRADADEKRAEAEELRAKQLSEAVTTLCDVTGRSHTLAARTDESVDRIERQIFHFLMWKRAATDAVAELASGREGNEKLSAALGAMKGAVSLIDAVSAPAVADLPVQRTNRQ